MRIGQCLGVAVALYTFVACSDDSGGGGTDSGSGGTTPQGQGGTNPQGQGGTNPQGQGGTEPNGSAGESGSPGDGGDPGMAGSAGEGGAAGAGSCATADGYECPPCEDRYVHVECGGRHCVCEPEDAAMKQEYEELLACDLDEPCPVSTQKSDIRLTQWENGECLLEALRDRTQGRYTLSKSGGDAGYTYEEITIIVDGSDEVIVFDKQTSGLLVGNLRRQYIPGTCTLKSAEALEDCVAAGTDVSDEEICSNVSDWVETCEVIQNPECPDP